MKTATVVVLALMQISCAGSNRQVPDPFNLDLPGPTLEHRVAQGYELKNRHVRVVIDDRTGDVVFWGAPGDARNLLWAQPMRFGVEFGVAGNFSEIISDGYIEPRDDQTWQYLGESKLTHLGWRKIYCLDGDHLNVSILVQNLAQTPQRITLGLYAGINVLPVASQFPNAEHFQGGNRAGNAHLQAYNEHPDLPAQPPYLILSDQHILKPNERISWTMQWTCRLSRTIFTP